MTLAALRRPIAGRPFAMALAAAAGVGIVVLVLLTQMRNPPAYDAIPDVLRAAAATIALFAFPGYAAARLLLPEPLQPHLPLLVLPVGAVVSCLALAFLGAFGLPLALSVALVLAGGAAGALVVRRRGSPACDPAALGRAGGRKLRLLWPLGIALAVAVLAALPQVRPDSLATVLGENGDAHLTTGAATLLQHAPPGAERPELPIDHMPAVWSSKYPIVYALAAVSTLSGLDPVQAFSTLIAVIAALSMVGLFLLAFHVLGASAGAALLGMGLVACDRIVFHLALEPYYNQVWGLFSMPFVLLFGWQYLWHPSRRSFVLLLGFSALSAFAYPLLLPFPAIFLAVAAVMVGRQRRAAGQPTRWVSALRLPRGRRALLLWIPVAVVVLPVGLLLTLAAAEKVVSAVGAVLPGGDLGPWSGSALGFLPLSWFFGLPEGTDALVAVPLALAFLGLRAAPREARLALGAMLGALFLGAGWFAFRGEGALFHFRALSFFAPVALLLAGLGISALLARARGRGRAAVAVGSAALATVLLAVTADQVRDTYPHAAAEVWELRSWGQRLPRGSSLRVDVTPIGVQQWASYMLAEHPLSASDPLRQFFPHPPVGRKADFIVVNRDRASPRDAAGAPVFANDRFALYRMDPRVPGPDVSSRELVDPLQGG